MSVRVGSEFASLPRVAFTYESLHALIVERAPVPGDVVFVSIAELEAVWRLAGRRRRVWFGHRIEVAG